MHPVVHSSYSGINQTARYHIKDCLSVSGWLCQLPFDIWMLQDFQESLSKTAIQLAEISFIKGFSSSTETSWVYSFFSLESANMSTVIVLSFPSSFPSASSSDLYIASMVLSRGYLLLKTAVFAIIAAVQKVPITKIITSNTQENGMNRMVFIFTFN